MNGIIVISLQFTVNSHFKTFIIIIIIKLRKMWTGHASAAFLAKSLFRSSLSLGTLMFASFLPDFIFFLTAMISPSIERLYLAEHLLGTFRYLPYYPFTHSLLGIFLIGLIFSLGHYRMYHSKKDACLILATVLSHFFLELPGHRKDITIIPFISPYLGAGLFNSVSITFILDAALIIPAYLLYISKSHFKIEHSVEGERWNQFLVGFLIFQHLFFCFGRIQITDARYVHPFFYNLLILATGYLAHRLDQTRVFYGHFLKEKKFDSNGKKFDSIGKKFDSNGKNLVKPVSAN